MIAYEITKRHPAWDDLPEAKKYEVGTIVYLFQKNDYGAASDETRVLKEECISISLTGNYPFFTFPLSHLQRIDNHE